MAIDPEGTSIPTESWRSPRPISLEPGRSRRFHTATSRSHAATVFEGEVMSRLSKVRSHIAALRTRVGRVRPVRADEGFFHGFEPLESRQFLATFDGGPLGTGQVWTDPINWVGDVLPTQGDSISIPGGRTCQTGPTFSASSLGVSGT